MLVKVMGSYAALYLFKIHAFYPCCGRITASLRGPNPIKLLCSFGANAGICRWSAPCAAWGECEDICGRVGGATRKGLWFVGAGQVHG